MTMKTEISEKQNNYILELQKESLECKIFFEKYMKATKKNPEKRNFQELLTKLIEIKNKEKKYNYNITKRNIEKIKELEEKTEEFQDDIGEYLKERKKISIEQLTEYNAIDLKLLYINKYLLKKRE